MDTLTTDFDNWQRIDTDNVTVRFERIEKMTPADTGELVRLLNFDNKVYSKEQADFARDLRVAVASTIGYLDIFESLINTQYDRDLASAEDYRKYSEEFKQRQAAEKAAKEASQDANYAAAITRAVDAEQRGDVWKKRALAAEQRAMTLELQLSEAKAS